MDLPLQYMRDPHVIENDLKQFIERTKTRLKKYIVLVIDLPFPSFGFCD